MLPLFIVSSIVESVGFLPIICIIAVVSTVVLIIRQSNKKRRLDYLRNKYQNEELVNRINNKKIWQGQTQEQLLDALGEPITIDNKVMKTKTREIWKYHQLPRNSYRLKITVENGLVIGWEERS